MKCSDIKYIVVHCSATREDKDIDIETLREWHTSPPREWSDVGYHFAIKRDGTIQAGRPLYRQGAHVKHYNDCSWGVCLIGGVDADDPQKAEFNYTEAQMHSLKELVDALLEKAPGAIICGHRDFPGVAKACPCFDVKIYFKEA